MNGGMNRQETEKLVIPGGEKVLPLDRPFLNTFDGTLHGFSQITNLPGLYDLKDDYNVGKPEIEVVVDREKAGMLWTNTGQIASTVRAAINGAEASKYRVGEDEYKIRVRL